MRNLKKILAMVLALVMSLSLMATAGAADFPDASSINEKYETAIEVLEGLGVFKGYQDGTFQPQGSITRAETAAIIYRIVTGDVKDEQVGIYADYNLFTDVPSTSWFAGYVNYCANAEYIKGVGGGKFNPNAQVTGYAALAMILRAIGYTANGGFTGSDWEVQTARTAESRKITKNIMTGTLGQNANRETVAEILFQAILVNMVDHNILNTNNGNQGYTEIDETLGYKTFKLEELEGVVVANEFANLYGTSVLANGKTNLEIVKDDVRNLDVTTELTDMGERQHVYITGSKVLSMDNTGLNTVKENDGAAVVIDTAAKFQAAAGMPAAADIEYFVNFDRVGNYTCDQRLEFRVTFQNANAMASFDQYAGVDTSAVAAADNLDNTPDNNWTVNTAVLGDNATNRTDATLPTTAGNLNASVQDYIFTAADYPVSFKKVIRAGNDISDADLAVIRGIFGAADNDITAGSNSTSTWHKDWITGDVFVGTKSTNNASTDEERDLSNQIGYNKFFEEYINAEVYDVNWDRADNGEWVKFIDNDGDGAADYAFLTQSNLDEVLSTYTKGDATVTEYYTFSDDADNWYSVRYLGDVPAVGDVVLYSFIDGQILVEAAKSEEVTVTDYSWKDDQIITDKGTYGQSGIENWTEMMELISAMKDNTKYAVYFDHFGYVRAYEIPGGTTYALVTEIYARNNANGNLVQEWPMNVELVVKDAQATEYNLVNGGRNIFVATTPWAQIQNMAAVGNYYNWLQPAIQHLGVTRVINNVKLGANKVDPTFSGDWNAVSTFWPSNRQIIRNIASIPAGDTFNYGAQNYASLSPLNNDGTAANWDRPQGATASFTNVAIVNINDNNATLEGAAQLRTDNRNNVLTWNDTNSNGVWDAGTAERARYAVDYIQLSTDNVVKGQARYPIYGSTAAGSYAANNNYYVNALDTTEYYIAYNGDVLYFQGYQNMPALTMADNRIHAAYAVARDTSADNANQPYWVADVIVYEVETYAGATTNGVSLAYYNPSRNTDQIQLLDTLSDKANPADVDLIPENLSWNADGGQFNQYAGYGFYKLTNPSAAEDGKMTARSISPINNSDGKRNFNKNGIFAGTIIRVYVLAGSSYIDINTDNKTNSDGTLRTNVSLKLDNNIYSITEQTVNEGTWNQITRNVANTLRYDGRQGYVANSQVKPNDRVIWVGSAPTNGTVGGSSFIVDLGNDITAGDNANAGLHYITPDWLFNRTLAADGVVGEINEQAHGWGLWADIMLEQTTAAPIGDAPVVTFFGQSVNTVAGTTITVNATYSQAVANDKTGADVSVKDGKLIIWNGVNVTDSNRETLLDLTVEAAGETYKATVLGDNGLYYDVTLVQAPAATGAQFEKSGIVQNASGGATSLKAPGGGTGAYEPIKQWLQSAKLNATSKTASVDWSIELNDGTKIKGTGTEGSLVLTPSIYNETSNDTVKMVTAVVTSEDGKTVTYYATGALGTFTVNVGEGIKVYGPAHTWNGSFSDPADVDASTAEQTMNVTYASAQVYQFVVNELEGEWEVTGAATKATGGVLNGQNWASFTFSGPATVTFKPTEDPTALVMKLGAGCGNSTPNTTTAQVSEIQQVYQKGDTISMKVEAATNYHIVKVTWANGAKSGEAKPLDGVYWQIPADETRNMTSGDLYINVEVASDSATLSITNKSTRNLEVKYLDPHDVTKYATATIDPGATWNGGGSGVNIDTRGTVTITAVGGAITVNAGAAVVGAPYAQMSADGLVWEGGSITGDLTLKIADKT